MDVNQDGWVDLIRISLPGEEAVWYENPGDKPGYWPMHPILKNAGNESPAFVDVDGDGRPDVIITRGWWEHPADATAPNWVFHPANFGEDCS